MGQGSWVSSIRPWGASLGRVDVGGRLVGEVLKRNRAGTRTKKAHEMRITAHEMRQPCLPIGNLMAQCGEGLRGGGPSRALTSGNLARLTGTRCGDGPSSSTIAPSPSLRTSVTRTLGTMGLARTRA